MRAPVVGVAYHTGPVSSPIETASGMASRSAIGTGSVTIKPTKSSLSAATPAATASGSMADSAIAGSAVPIWLVLRPAMDRCGAGGELHGRFVIRAGLLATAVTRSAV
jgi:hypothetical protein